ncbi:MAG TPA: tRNA-intron lyase [Nitrososphaeraceae archaeon]
MSAAVNPFSSPSSSSSSSTNDFSFTVEGSLSKNGSVIIPDTRSQDQLRNKGYGEVEGSNYILRPYEVLHLIHSKRLKAFKNKKKEPLDFDSALRLALKYDKEMLTKFLIYRDLRTRGYVAKEGFGFGADFRVYERGTFEKKVAKYVVFGINEGTNTKLSNFSKIISDIRIMGKEAIVAVVERRGEVIYYKLDKIKFTENKNTKNFLP